MSRLSPKNKPGKVEKASPPPPPAPVQSHVLLKALIIILAGLFIYAPAFHGTWLWDDDQEITANAVLPDPAGLIKAWQGEGGADYFPLKTSVQWILWRFAGNTVTTYHVANVVLHLLNALLLWKLLARLGLRAAWLGGLLFAVHPILVESVAWISELKNTLSLPFLLLSMLAYVAYGEKGGARNYIFALLLFLAAILCKTSVVMYPVTLLLYDWWKRGKSAAGEVVPTFAPARWLVETASRLLPRTLARDLVVAAPFFLISLIMGLITIKFQHERAIGSETIPVGGMLSRTAMAGLAIAFYTWKTLIPTGLLPIYPRWEVDPPSPLQFLPWLVLAGLLIFFWTKRRTWGRDVLFGYGFFLITLVPVLGFITMSYMRITWVADHFVYLPAIGLIGLVAGGAGHFYHTLKEDTRPFVQGITVLIFAVLIIGSHRYSGVFAGEEPMWSYTLKHNPDAWQAHSRYGKVKIENGQIDAAFFHLSEAARLRPDLAETHNNLGAVLEQKGGQAQAAAQQSKQNGQEQQANEFQRQATELYEKALSELRKAHKIAPEIIIYQINLANLLVRLNQHSEGLLMYGQLLLKEPNNALFHCNYGVALYFLGRDDEAISHFEQALAIHPDLKDAKDNLAAARARKAAAAAPSQSPPQSAPAPTAPPATIQPLPQEPFTLTPSL